MWVLVFVAMLNGQVYLDAKLQADKSACLKKLSEMLVVADEAKIPFGAVCKEIKIA